MPQEPTAQPATFEVFFAHYGNLQVAGWVAQREQFPQGVCWVFGDVGFVGPEQEL